MYILLVTITATTFSGGEGGDEEIKKVLVQGHPYPWDNNSHKHFLYDDIIKNTNKNTIIQTADISTTIIGPDIQMDAFNPPERSHNHYDVLWLPDLGGEWYVKQNLHELPEYIANQLIGLIEKAKVVVKPGGIIFVSKILDHTVFELMLSKLNSSEYLWVRNISPYVLEQPFQYCKTLRIQLVLR